MRHCPCLQVFNLVRERKKYDVYPTNNTNRDLVVARGERKKEKEITGFLKEVKKKENEKSCQ